MKSYATIHASKDISPETMQALCEMLTIVSKGDFMPSTTIQFFEYEHLPAPLQEVSKPFYTLAHLMEDTLPDGPEKSAGMRKLLEAKDCFVRAKLEKKGA